MVSVIVPVYNTERYLAQCLESILAQTLADIEILVVDDCSPDGSARIIRHYEQQDDRLVYIRHESNLGLGGARNTGIAAARGKYIAGVDSDDALTERALEVALGRCEADETEIGVFSSSDYVEGTGKLETNPFHDLDQFPPVLYVDESNILKLFPTFQLKLYSRALIERYGVRFPDHLYHEDDEFYWKLFGCALPRVSIIPKRLYLRTKRADQTSIMDNTAKSRKDMPRVLLNAYRFLSERDAFGRIREAYIYKTCRNLYLTTYVHEQFRKQVFADMAVLLNELCPRDEEVGNRAWLEEIREIRKGDYVGYLQWKVDSLQRRSRRLQREARAELEQIYASTSWRLTAPLRWISSKVRVRNRQ